MTRSSSRRWCNIDIPSASRKVNKAHRLDEEGEIIGFEVGFPFLTDAFMLGGDDSDNCLEVLDRYLAVVVRKDASATRCQPHLRGIRCRSALCDVDMYGFESLP